MNQTHHLDPVTRIIQRCGGDLWGSCAQFPASDWRSEVDARDTQLGYWAWVLSQAEAEGIDIEDLTPEAGRLSVLDDVAAACGWTEGEKRHAKENIHASYGPECILSIENGREIRTPPAPGLCSYVRVVQYGYEIAFLEHREFQDDAASALGVLIASARGCDKVKG